MTFCSLPAERMAERAADDVRSEQRGRAAARQQQQAGGGDRSSRAALPSPEAALGQPWNHWLQHAKLPPPVTELEERFKEHGKGREAMRLNREDMPIFGLCPAYDDFYLVMCNHCNQVIKPQAFQSHYERRHSSLSKQPLTPPSSSVYSLLSSLPKNKGSIGSGSNRPSSGSSASSNSKMLKSPKEKLQMIVNRPMHPVQHNKLIHDKIMTPSVKVEKMHLNPKLDGVLLKPAAGPTCSTTVSSSKTGLNCPSIPKPPLPSPGHIPNGKGLLSSPPFLEKKPEDSTNNRKFLHKRLSEREFDPDIHCGVVDVETKKPCTRSLTCKTHSLGYRRAVQGRRKRFDVLLAEHKSNTRERELLRNSEHPQQMPALRESHPSPSKPSQELHQNSHGVVTSESKHSLPCKPKPLNPSLPRPAGNPVQHSGNAPSDSPSVHESPHPVVPAVEPTSRLSSDDGEGDEKEELAEKLDCHYSGHHPRPAAVCSFGSRQIGRGCYVYDKRWDHIRCALNFMVDKHLNSQMWKKIPPASNNSMSTHAPHRSSTNSIPVLQHSVRATGFLSPTTVASSPMPATPTCTSVESKVLSCGTSLNTHPSTVGPVCSMQSRQVSSSPSMPSVLSSVPSPMSSKPQKLKFNKSLKPKESSASSINCTSSSGCSGKKRKNSSPLLAQSSHSMEYFRKNCAVNSGTSNHTSMVSLSHSNAHSIGVNCLTNKANTVSLRHDQSGRGPPTGSPAESIKRMSVVMNSSDSTLSLGPFVHQSSEQTVNSHGSLSHSQASLDKFIAKKHKCSPGSSSINSSKSTKVAKLPSVNNVHSKHASAIPGTQGMTNSSLLHQSILNQYGKLRGEENKIYTWKW